MRPTNAKNTGRDSKCADYDPMNTIFSSIVTAEYILNKCNWFKIFTNHVLFQQILSDTNVFRLL